MNEDCVICMNSLQQKTLIKNCNHAFCYECICTWSKTRRSCPLCNTKFTTLVVIGDQDQIVKEEEAPVQITSLNQSDIQTDLQALDHVYFLSECSRLLGSAENAQQTMLRARKQNCHTKYRSVSSNTVEEKNWKIIQSIILRLTSYVELFKSEDRFDPYLILQDLYQIQDNMQRLWKHPFGQVHSEPIQPRMKYSADDCDNLSSDEEDDYDFGDFRSKSKNNNKPNRSPRKSFQKLQKKF